jgi:hypothetical protein
MSERYWWDRWYVIAILALLSVVPLLWPTTPPLVDVPGHLSRLRVEIDLNTSPYLRRYFAFQWQLVGNLGLDLLIVPVSRLVSLEFGVKLIVLTVPPLTTLGLLLLSREIHGRIQPAAFFSLPFVYGYPFVFGFINSCLAIALALFAFILWLRLSRSLQLRKRAVLFVPISCVIWLVHVFGWGVLGLLCWSSELFRLKDRGEPFIRAALRAAASCLPLMLPIAAMLLGAEGEVSGRTSGYFEIGPKILSLFSALRDRWIFYDCMSVAVSLVLVGSAIFDRHMSFSRRLLIPTAILAVAFIIIPLELFGSAYADMRLIPLILALAILALHVTSEIAVEQRLAILGLVFFAVRLTGSTFSFAISDREASRTLAALQFIPPGSPVLILVGGECGKVWAMPRYSHLGSFVITRKHGFTNDQFPSAGHLSVIKYKAAGKFMNDPSELTFSIECRQAKKRHYPPGELWDRYIRRHWPTADERLDAFPAAAFDYVWLIKPEGFTDRPRPLLKLIWSRPDTALYQVQHQPNQLS